MVGMTPTKRLTPVEEYMTLEQIAAEIGVAVGSVRVYHQRAAKNRREDSTLPGDMPPPDRVFGRSPAWRSDTVRAWIARRPGRGYGGKRKAA